MPAPPPESEPATISTRPFIPSSSRGPVHPNDLPLALFGRLGRNFRLIHAARSRQDLIADRADDIGQQVFILTLGHDPYHRLGSRFADDQPPGRPKPYL